MSKKEEPIFTLDFTMGTCYVRAFVNGFPVFDYNAHSKANYSVPINTALVSGTNKLRVEILPPLMPPGKMSLVADIKINGGVKVYENFETTGPDAGDLLLAISEKDLDLTAIPIILEKEFETYGPNFRQLFYMTKPFEDDEALKDYGIKLRDLVKAGDTENLLKEFEYKANDFAKAFYDEPDDYFEQFRVFMNYVFLKKNPITGFPREQIVLKSWCEKRIWEIGLMPDEELLRTEPDEEEEIIAIKIFVAKLKDGLKVVR